MHSAERENEREASGCMADFSLPPMKQLCSTRMSHTSRLALRADAVPERMGGGTRAPGYMQLDLSSVRRLFRTCRFMDSIRRISLYSPTARIFERVSQP